MSGLVDYIQDALAPLGPVQNKRFFGGRGLMLGEALFAFVIDEKLWLRVDAQTVAAFDAAGCEPFSYGRSDGRMITVGAYRAAPAEALDDPHALLDCCRQAWGAAQRAEAGKRKAAPRAGKKPAAAAKRAPPRGKTDKAA